MTHDLHATPRMALVVFVDHTEIDWLRILKTGFRHCFVAVEADRSWLICDPLKDRIALSLLQADKGFDLGAFYAGKGYSVLAGRAMPMSPRRRHIPEPLTCVAIVKRILGIDAPGVFTPWGLFKHLSAAVERVAPWHRVDPPAHTEPASRFLLDNNLN